VVRGRNFAPASVPHTKSVAGASSGTTPGERAARAHPEIELAASLIREPAGKPGTRLAVVGPTLWPVEPLSEIATGQLGSATEGSFASLD
jgi:hypothetical protein